MNLLHTAESFLRSQLVLQLIKKFPALYGTRKFITVLTSARQLSLSCVRSIQSIPPHPTSWRSILILSPHLRLAVSSGLFPWGLPTKTLYTPVLSPIHATCPAHLILLDFITRNNIGWGAQIISELHINICTYRHVCCVFSVRAVNTYRGSRNVAALIFNPIIRWRWVVNFTSWRLIYPRERIAVPME